MDAFDLRLDDLLFFELQTLEHVEAFSERIRPRWDGWSDEGEHEWLFTAQLNGDGDLAPLLREVQELVAELGLPGIRYCLDGRLYVLDAVRSPVGLDRAARSE